MIAGKLISKTIVPLRTSDTGHEALAIMNDFYIRHLPIVNNKQLLGLISEDDILNNIVEEPVGSYHLTINKPYVKEYDHVFEVMRLVGEYQLSVIPVVDAENNYTGLITQDKLIQYFAKSASFTERGSIIVLEMGRQDYSLTEITRLVESENAVVLSSFVTTNPDSTRVEVSLKVNRQEIRDILATFERFNYTIKGSYQETNYYDDLRERFDSLMSYLNI